MDDFVTIARRVAEVMGRGTELPPIFAEVARALAAPLRVAWIDAEGASCMTIAANGDCSEERELSAPEAVALRAGEHRLGGGAQVSLCTGSTVRGAIEGPAALRGAFEALAPILALAIRDAGLAGEVRLTFDSLKKNRAQMAQSERLFALGELAAGVAHDFNNVLSAILGRAQMLKVLHDDPEVLRSLEVIEQAALDGAGTVRRIQEFARHRPERDFTSVSIEKLALDTVERTRPRIERANAELVLRLESSASVLANPSELRQVLTNLIHNGLDAMPSGGQLVVATGGDGRGQVWFEVKDAGVGMDEATRQRMFDPFFTTKGAKGTGLGLSVSYAIVQRHSGEFEVWSEKGAGTRIRVSLPALGPKMRDPSINPTPSSTRSPLTRARILLVDDDDAVRDSLADILRTGDHDVVTACAGPEGVEKFRAGGFDLVFTDLGMPGMNGCEMAGLIKALDPKVPVGLVTGWGVTMSDQELGDLGVDLVVAKPFRYQQVLDLVAEAMTIRRRLKGTAP